MPEIAINKKLSSGKVNMWLGSKVYFLLFSYSLFYLSFSQNTLAATPITDKSNKTVRVAVSANFTSTLHKLLPTFERQTGISVQVVNGSSGTLFQQIAHGAPFDIFLSADAVRPKKLDELKLVQPGFIATYAFGKLALWSANLNAPLTDKNYIHLIKRLSNNNQRLAIANPNIAPYGLAAKQTLTHLGLWEIIKKQLVTGINVNQSFQQVHSQAIQLGFVAHSQLIENNYNGVLIPQKYYQPIKQQMVVLKAAKNSTAAKQLFNFLLSKPTQSRLAAHGYTSVSNRLSAELAE